MKKILKVLAGIIGVILLAGIGLLVFLRITEYRPADKETVDVTGQAKKTLTLEDDITIMTYNIGYGANAADQDFFMDGGKNVQPESSKITKRDIKGITEQIAEVNPDVAFIQEADIDSQRSFHINEVQELADSFGGTLGFAPNFKVSFIPYPIPPIGKVYGGLAMLNSYQADSAERIAFPSAFSWPVSMCQLKRCLLVERVPIEDSDKEIVFVNLHLEAYDDGEGKLKQTQILADFVQEEYEKGNYVIAGGDFNQYFSCADMSKYPVKDSEHFQAGKLEESLFGDDWQIVMDDSTPTSRLLNEPYDPDSEDTQYYMLDGFIVSPNLEIDELKTLDYGFQYTDHNPVKITIHFKE